MSIRVVAVGIGSVGPSSKFAWAAFDAPGRDLIADGTDPETAVSALASGLLTCRVQNVHHTGEGC